MAGTFGPTATKQILASPEKRGEINRWGKKTLDLILEEPTVENFLRRSLEFAERTGFATPNTRKLVKLVEQAGAIGAAQNMVGEAVHAVTTEKNAESLVKAFEEVLPSQKILTARIDFQGARLIKT